MSRRRIAVSIWIGLLIVLGAIGFLSHRKDPSPEAAVSQNAAVAYVLQADGKWQRPSGNPIKPGEELRAGDTLTPQPADKSSVLRIYEFGKGPKTISGELGTYHVATSTDAAAGSTDWLTMLLPRVKDVFPEETISRGVLEEPYTGPLLIGDQGVDVAPLKNHEAKGRVRKVRLRFLSVPIGSSHSARSKAESGREFAYVWDPAKLGPVAGTNELPPGLYRLQVWSTPKGTRLPAVDSATAPDGEHLVVLVRGDHDYQQARREFDAMIERIDHEWNKDLPADLRASFVKACLIHIAEPKAPAGKS